MFESAVRAVTRRFAKELWQVTSPLPRAVHPLPVWAASWIEIP